MMNMLYILPLLLAGALLQPSHALDISDLTKKLEDTIVDTLGKVSDAATPQEKWVEEELDDIERLIDLYNKARSAEDIDYAKKKTSAFTRKYQTVYIILLPNNKAKNGCGSPITQDSLKPAHQQCQAKRMDLYQRYLKARCNIVKKSPSNLKAVQSVGCVLQTHLYDDVCDRMTNGKLAPADALEWVKKENDDFNNLFSAIRGIKNPESIVPAIEIMERMLCEYAPLYPCIRGNNKCSKLENNVTDCLKEPHERYAEERAGLFIQFLSCRNIFLRFAPAYTSYLKQIEKILLTHQEERAAKEKSRFTRNLTTHH